jgi:CRISPR-associated protein Cst2
MKKLFSVSISGRATMNLHSLNNEGGEGNHIQTRMVDIVDAGGKLHPVNAVSGDMFKHIFVEHFHALALEHGLKLCAGCRTMNANRLNADPDFAAALKDKSNAETMNMIPQWCAMDDVAGILITQGNRSVGRKGVLELSWVTGIPEKVKTDSFFHVKYAPDSRAKTGEEGGGNSGQAIFHRPASSGQYALVAHLEAYRIGLNDITQQYAIDEAEREKRYKLALQALAHTFLEPNGAMRATQNPHLTAFEGVITTSISSVPAPTVSAINPDFQEQVEGIAKNLNRFSQGALEVHHFASLAGFAEKMADVWTDSGVATFGK